MLWSLWCLTSVMKSAIGKISEIVDFLVLDHASKSFGPISNVYSNTLEVRKHYTVWQTSQKLGVRCNPKLPRLRDSQGHDVPPKITSDQLFVDNQLFIQWMPQLMPWRTRVQQGPRLVHCLNHKLNEAEITPRCTVFNKIIFNTVFGSIRKHFLWYLGLILRFPCRRFETLLDAYRNSKSF